MAHCGVEHNHHGHNHQLHAHDHCHHDHGHSHAHKSTPQQAKISAATSHILEHNQSTQSSKEKKQEKSFTALQYAALTASAGAVAFVFFHIYNRASTAYTFNPVPLEANTNNPITSTPLTFKPNNIAIAMLVESLFFLKQMHGSATLEDFKALAKSSPSIAAKHINDWKDAAVTVAFSLLCAKNNGATTHEQDKIALYAAHTIAPEHDKQELIEHALGCRNLTPINKETFRNDASSYLQILDQHVQVSKSLKNHNPILARIQASRMDLETTNYQTGLSLQHAAHSHIDKAYDTLAQRSDGLKLFEKSLDGVLNNSEFFENGMLSSAISDLLLQELVRFRQAAFKYAPFNQDLGSNVFWDQKLQNLLNISTLTPTKLTTWYSLISSQGHRFTPWLSILLEKLPITSEGMLRELQPNTSIDREIQQAHKIISLQSYIKNHDLDKSSFDSILMQIEEILQTHPSLKGNEKDLKLLIQNLVNQYRQKSSFLSSQLYSPPIGVSRKCLTWVHDEFLKQGETLTDVLLPFMPNIRLASYRISTELSLNIEIYKGKISADQTFTLLKKVINHKKSEDWNLRLSYLQKIIELTTSPTQKQLVDWCIYLVASLKNDQDANNMLNILLSKISEIESSQAIALIQYGIRHNASISHLQKILEVAPPSSRIHLAKHILEALASKSYIPERTDDASSHNLLMQELDTASGISTKTSQGLISKIITHHGTENLDLLFKDLEKFAKAMPRLNSNLPAVWTDLLQQISSIGKAKGLNLEPTNLLNILFEQMPNINVADLSKMINALSASGDLVMKSYLESQNLDLNRMENALQIARNYPNWDNLPKMIVEAYKKQSKTFLQQSYNWQKWDKSIIDKMNNALTDQGLPQEKEHIHRIANPRQGDGIIRQ